MKQVLLPAVATVLAPLAMASAAPFTATYHFNNTNGTADAPAAKAVDVQPAGVTFSDFAFSDSSDVNFMEDIGGKGANGANVLGSIGWGIANYEDDKYYGFTVTATGGDPIQLGTIAFTLIWPNGYSGPSDSGGWAPRDARLLVSAGGAVSFHEVWSLEDKTHSGGNVAQGYNVSLDAVFPSPAMEYEFRFQHRDQDPGQTLRVMRIDTVSLTGEVVPEPALISLLGLGGLALMRRRNC